MHSFKDHIDEAQALKFYNLLPKKVRHTINRIRNQDKYKAALLMIKHMRKDPDVISRGLTKARIQGIAADYFGLNHRELSKVLNRQTRYEEAPPGMADTVKKFKADGMADDMAFALAWKIYNKKKEEVESITEAYTITYTGPNDIDGLGYSSDQVKDIEKLYKELKKKEPNQPNPLIFDTKGGEIKVHRDTFEPDGGLPFLNKLTVDAGAIAPSLRKGKLKNGNTLLIYGTGSASKQKTVDVAAFGIENDTKFFEFWQAIGLFISKPLTADNFKKMLTNLTINGDFKIREFIKEGQKGWDKFIDYCVLDPEVGQGVIYLVNGSYHYRQSIKPAMSSDNAFVIWHDIKDYYTALKTKEGITSTVKENTADCVLVNGDKQKLYDALAKDESTIETDDTTGMLTCDGVEWYQISLKKGKDDARLGKLTKLLKGMYKTPDNLDAAEVNAILEQRLIDEALDKDFEQLLQEGFFGDVADKFKKVGGDVFKKFKEAAVAIFQYWLKLKKFIGRLAKKYEKDTMKEIDRLTKRSLKEELLLEKATTAEKLSAIVNGKGPRGLNKKYVDIIDKNYKNIAGTEIKDEVVSVLFDKQTVKITNSTINFLVGNVISMKILTDVIEDVNVNGIDVINKLTQSMSMGDTNMPVVKVYGTAGDSAEYEVITVGSITQENPLAAKTGEQIKILYAAVQPHKSKPYYVINMWIFAEMKKEEPHYHQVAFKKSGSSSFNYNIEGTTTVPESKITLFK